jgi:hypothetical protein
MARELASLIHCWWPEPALPQVDSASTPEQLSRLLDDVKEAGSKRVLLVFGCPGTTNGEQRAEMAQASIKTRQ